MLLAAPPRPPDPQVIRLTSSMVRTSHVYMRLAPKQSSKQLFDVETLRKENSGQTWCPIQSCVLFCCSWATVMTIVVNNLWTVLLSAFKIWLVEIQRLLFDCTRLTWIQKTCTSKFKNANTQNIKHQICFRKCTWKPHVLLKKACLWQPLANSFEFC